MEAPQKQLFSEHWYRVKALRPQLRPHTKLHRHQYRGDIWYVLEDGSSGQYHRFGRAAHHIIGRMNGERDVQTLWEDANTAFGDNAPVQDEIIHLLGQLHQIDALQTDIAPDVDELFRRSERIEREQWQGRVKNPLAVRLSLFDPDRFLSRTLSTVRPLYSRPFFMLWCAVVLLGVTQAGMHWETLLATAQDQALAPSNLIMMVLIYPFIKLLHELAHGYAAKLYGGEVHEMGIMFLVFMPVPYVDASAATALRERRMRMLVGAAGIMVELFFAALALLLWLVVEPGLISTLCFNVMLLGGVSTLLFNGNPLLRFDGYYVLADAVGIPNLAQRANRYLTYLVQRYLLGMRLAQSPVTSRGERPWFVLYSIASFAYRMVLLGTICFYLLENFFVVGVLLAAWAVYSQIAAPLLKQLRFLLADASLRHNRPRALLASGLCAALVLGVFTLLPVSSLTRFEGVIQPPERSQLVVQTDGFIDEYLAKPGSHVEAGSPLVKITNIEHRGQMRAKQARMDELKARFRLARISSRVETRLLQEEMTALEGDIARLQQKIDGTLLVSPTAGRFIVPKADDLPGQFVQQGQPVGYVVDDQAAIARVVVTQQDQERIAQQLEAIELRVAGALDAVWPGKLLRSVPQAGHELPSKVLTVEGGGNFRTDPLGLTPLSTRERLFEYDVLLPVPAAEAGIGSRVYVRFDHGRETLWAQLSRRVRQLFLGSLNV